MDLHCYYLINEPGTVNKKRTTVPDCAACAFSNVAWEWNNYYKHYPPGNTGWFKMVLSFWNRQYDQKNLKPEYVGVYTFNHTINVLLSGNVQYHGLKAHLISDKSITKMDCLNLGKVLIPVVCH